jgi:hypothetical protein
MIFMPYFLNKLALAVISVGLGSVVVFHLSGLELSEADKECLRKLELSAGAGCRHESNTSVSYSTMQKRDR